MNETGMRERLYAFLKAYTEAHGYGPSVREICGAMELRSTATVHYHLRRLREEGRILMEPGKYRSISLPRAGFSENIEKRRDNQNISREKSEKAVSVFGKPEQTEKTRQEKPADFRENHAFSPGKSEHGRRSAPEGRLRADPLPGPADIPGAEPLLPPGGYVPLVGTVAAGRPILARENLEGWLPWEGGEGWFALRVKGESMKNAGILPGDTVIVRPQPTAENGEIVVALLEDEATVKRLARRGGHLWLLPENEAYDPIPGDEAAILGVVRGVLRKYG